jgi:uncharacterized protein
MYNVSLEAASMLTRDGVRLDADVYRPQSAEIFPVLLMRQPYGRAIASTVVYAHPRWYAAQGYIVVIQDVRGRGSSEGSFQLFAAEVDDGEDSVIWAAGLPGSNGQVGMYGFSYQGMTQLYAAARQPQALKVLCPAMLAYDLYNDWAYEGGAFCLQAGLGWAIQLAAETARLAGDAEAFGEWSAAARNLPVHGEIPSQPEILARLAPESFYHDWLEHSQGDEAYWQSLVPNLTNVDLPMLHIGGWFDPYLRGTLNLFDRVASQHSPLRMQSPQLLHIGPWGHLPWGRRVGQRDFGPEAVSSVDQLQLRWFNQFLKGIDTGLLEQQPISLFEMGGDRWRHFATWPEAGPGESIPEENSPEENPSSENRWAGDYRLQSDGLAAMREDVGRLRPVSLLNSLNLPNPLNPNDGEQPAPPLVEDVIVHDPWRPVPALGGHNAFPSGPFERGAIDGRSDVAVYTTAPFEEDWAIAGDIRLEIHCESDAPSFDLCAVLSEVQFNGGHQQVFNFSQGYRRISPAEKQPGDRAYGIQLQATCIRIAKGNALRLSLSAACFPAYAVNPGTGQHPNVTAQVENQVITLRILTGGTAASRLLLPLAVNA